MNDRHHDRRLDRGVLRAGPARSSSASSTLEPFQAGFLAATHPDQEGEFGNGKAAMMLQGQWAAERSGVGKRVQGRASAKRSAGSPFPEVEGGAGLPTDVFGGGDNFVVGRDAPPEAVEFAQVADDRS